MQVCDPTFPIGAYAHSYGLETYVQRGIVRNAASAARYVAQQLAGPLCYTELLGMRLAYERATAGDLKAVARLEALLSAYKAPRELREAAQKLAARFMRTAGDLLAPEAGKDASCARGGRAASSAGGAGDKGGDARAATAHARGETVSGSAAAPAREAPAGAELFARYAAAGPHMVNAAYGVFAAAAGIPLEALMRRYLFAQVSALVTTCVKAVPLSQTAGQRILRDSYAAQGGAYARALEAEASDLGRAAPGFDVRAIEHETLYSRLYMS